MTDMLLPILLLLLTDSPEQGHKPINNGLVGSYYSRANQFEKHSNLYLRADSSFVYSYLLGGCQDEISGVWSTKGNNLYLIQAKDTTTNRLYHIPDLAAPWRITKSGLKPLKKLNLGCFEEASIHRKLRAGR
ncbi:hypothetical protein [Solirubrum puertoriconensis]|uniref:hypothetical protein n=1 Tax=Solirubrum puertoriconensis TaxID=1751427 RepID=UPI00122E8BAE|nr:hypothetical protein [Solirubrum puertoriconensis]